ncbi:exodeoxyribonuclease VII large subunit [Myroides sp. NP-2]|uniref:exodeoxyribonuclease VII large subunit n=1 Tax=Myroides sp. NP-2 TaxID=2759945 RepID=UPI0015F99320|nr:exodeoxyribonuclease VII large subunit [Myroides sp. NP-2]MBB1150931.1 exodeoxyribonuclease VII large subunit [Myroides sp. NP-2]
MQDNRKIFSLHAILNRVQQVFDELMLGKFFWVKVEVLKVNKDRKGHYYLELVEQVEDQVLAKCRATIWSRHVERCVIEGGEDLEKVVKEGAEILCYGEAIFHPVYGFSLQVIHVDYAFSLGEIERKKQQTLLQLDQRGLLSLNKGRSHPLVIQHIAVVASVGTSGYEDFVQHLEQNPHHFSFVLTCYDTQVQGEGAVTSLLRQLEVVSKGDFDAVVIIRGGGSKFDLDVFNAIQVAEKIAQMPFAVFTGIGHETDRTVADDVAHTAFKTPSAVASFILSLAFEFAMSIAQGTQALLDYTARILKQHTSKLAQLEDNVGRISKFRISESQSYLDGQTTELDYVIKQLIQRSASDLRFVELAIETEVHTQVKKRKNELKDRSTRLALWAKQNLGLEQQKMGSTQEMIVARLRYKLAQSKATLVQMEEILSLYNLEHLLKKGFAVVRHQGKVLHASTPLSTGDTVDVMIYNKTYRIVIGSIEEIEQWKNLLMNEQQTN